MQNSFKNDILISIILPVYNGQNFLDKAIESCLYQTYNNFELFIINDCSTDNSLQIAEKFAKQDSRITVISNSRNLKLPASLNVGHQRARGNYITWISDDNCLKKDALEKMLNTIVNKGVDVVYSNYELIDESGDFLKNVELGNRSILLGNSIGASFLYKKEVFDRNSGYSEDLHLTEDYDFWLRASCHSSFFHIEEYLYQYRGHGNSLTSSINLEKSVNREFSQKLESIYQLFFSSFKNSSAAKYSKLFSRLHLYQETNTKYLLEIYKDIMNETSILSKKCKNVDFSLFKQGFDKMIRSTILYNRENQTLEVLFRIIFYHPEILIGYEKRRSLTILKRCLGIHEN